MVHKHLFTIGNINIPDPKLIVVQPFDKSSINEIEKSIQNEDIGLNPAVDGDIIRIPIPAYLKKKKRINKSSFKGIRRSKNINKIT